jgi:diacylglycerol kinase family enzyme
MLPNARINDGAFDCLLIEMASKWEALHLIPLVYRQALERHKRVIRFRTRSLSVSLNPPSRLCNDGEVYSTPFQQLDYTVIRQKLPVICRAREDLVTKAQDISEPMDVSFSTSLSDRSTAQTHLGHSAISRPAK